MKKLLTLCALLTGMISSAQVYQKYPQYGGEWNRLWIKSNLSIPNDTVPPPTTATENMKMYPGLAAKGDSLYYWSVAAQKYVLFQFGNGWQSVDAGYGLVAVNDSTLRVDTTGLLSNYWGVRGNTGTTPDIHWIGTNDAAGFMAKVNGVPGLFISGGNPTTFPWEGGSATYLGKGAGVGMGTGSSESVLIGKGVGYYATGLTASVVVGHGAAARTTVGSDGFGTRTTVIGYYSNFSNMTGSNNATLGAFTMEKGVNADNSVAVGRDALRSVRDGDGNIGIGLFGLLYNSTGVKSITVTNGGSGYTTATVAISAPWGSSSPGVCWGTATATANISGGSIVSITITYPGCGYNTTGGSYVSTGFPTFDNITAGATVTITGDGTGATATATLQDGINNIGLGVAAGGNNRIGKSNIHIGNLSGWNVTRWWDEDTYFLGTNTSVDASVDAGTLISNAGAFGKNAKAASSNMLALGGTGSDAIRVGIGTINPDASSALDIVSTTKGALLPRMNGTQQAAISSPATGLIIYNTDSSGFCFYDGSIWSKIGSGTGGGGGVTTLAAIGATPNANGATISGNTLNLQPADGSFGGIVTTGTQTFAGDKTFNDNVNIGGTGKTLSMFNGSFGGTSVNNITWGSNYNEPALTLNDFGASSKIEWGLKIGYMSFTMPNNIRFAVHESGNFAGSSSSNERFVVDIPNTKINLNYATAITASGTSYTPDASAVLEVQSTTQGVLMPRMTATQGSAISSPADGLIIYVTSTNGTFTSVGFWGRENGVWIKL